ncbi:hypothetical protein [Staphylococcus equorum]|nr:hypothetical protein [Staphylococcus equorum]
MNLTYLPQWEIINQSQKQFIIQEDANSIHWSAQLMTMQWVS